MHVVFVSDSWRFITAIVKTVMNDAHVLVEMLDIEGLVVQRLGRKIKPDCSEKILQEIYEAHYSKCPILSTTANAINIHLFLTVDSSCKCLA